MEQISATTLDHETLISLSTSSANCLAASDSGESSALWKLHCTCRISVVMANNMAPMVGSLSAISR
jgi:hypothetical protein